MTSIGVLILSTKWWGELAAVICGVISRRQ
jgi:hypothetical protein